MHARPLALFACLGLATSVAPSAFESRLASAAPNDNRVSAGQLEGGVLRLRLEALEVSWRPEGPKGVGIPVYAFAEAGKQASVPGPMIRVPAGTEVSVSVRNTLPSPMRLKGLSDHTGTALDSVVLAPGETRDWRFRPTVPGTYYYFGRAVPMEPERGWPGRHRDALLLGAFIVDSSGATPPPNERVLVVSLWADTLSALGDKPAHADRALRREMFPRDRWGVAAVNGLSWPHTERLSYTEGDTVRWRVINGSSFPHPMHLHGFYFDVRGMGDAVRDTVYTPAQQRKAVTEWLLPGATMSMAWTPDRPGNWLFHCHIVSHIADAMRLDTAETRHSPTHGNHAEQGMAGLVVGIRVSPKRGDVTLGASVPRRRMRLFVTQRDRVYGNEPGYAFVLQEGAAAPRKDSVVVPSSTLVLRQGEPTEITVFNVASEPTAIHWHGLELESWYDGVSGWSGWRKEVAPVIAPGDSFVVRLTPVRAGTFMYHTHVREEPQIASGLYGALIVIPRDARPDTTERVLLLAIDGPAETAQRTVNGSRLPRAIEVRAGVAHRFRFINISPLESSTIQLLAGDKVQPWRALAKDGFELPAHQAKTQPGVLPLHPGETYDFEVMRQRPETLTLRINNPQTIEGRWTAFNRGQPLGTLPRSIMDIPVIVR